MQPFTCVCCVVRAQKTRCTMCVYTICESCSHCRRHCVCPQRHARECEPDPELDAPGGPFHGLVPDPAGRDGAGT